VKRAFVLAVAAFCAATAANEIAHDSGSSALIMVVSSLLTAAMGLSLSREKH
jgi:hypothetical protein